MTLGGINVSGVEGYEDYVLTGISGLTVGEEIEVPGDAITNAVKRYWKHGLFSKVAIAADSIVGEKLYLHIYLAVRPRISDIHYVGLKKSEREDMEQKLGMVKGTQVTPNMLDRAKILAKKYFDDKGFKNAEIQINQRDDVANKAQVSLRSLCHAHLKVDGIAVDIHFGRIDVREHVTIVVIEVAHSIFIFLQSLAQEFLVIYIALLHAEHGIQIVSSIYSVAHLVDIAE